MTVEEFYQYCQKMGLTDHKIKYSIMTDQSGGQCEKELEGCDIEEYRDEILITDHSRD